MKTRFEEKEKWDYSEEKCFNFSCEMSCDTKDHVVDNGCEYTANTGKCKNFIGANPEEKTDMEKLEYMYSEIGIDIRSFPVNSDGFQYISVYGDNDVPVCEIYFDENGNYKSID